jgi:hypothetical protein
MGRIRTIKPEFWKHEGLSALPEATHMLAAALLNYADDEGYFNANPALIQAECFPLRELSRSVPVALLDLSNEGFLQFGTAANGRRYGRIVHFRNHQTINKPTPSKIKSLEIVWEDYGSPPVALPVGTGNREQGTGKDSRRGDQSPREFIWDAGLNLLLRAGDKEPAARAFIGKLCKKHGDEAVRDVMGRAIATAPAEPKAWIARALNGTETPTPWEGAI